MSELYYSFPYSWGRGGNSVMRIMNYPVPNTPPFCLTLHFTHAHLLTHFFLQGSHSTELQQCRSLFITDDADIFPLHSICTSDRQPIPNEGLGLRASRRKLRRCILLLRELRRLPEAIDSRWRELSSKTDIEDPKISYNRRIRWKWALLREKVQQDFVKSAPLGIKQFWSGLTSHRGKIKQKVNL